MNLWTCVGFCLLFSSGYGGKDVVKIVWILVLGGSCEDCRMRGNDLLLSFTVYNPVLIFQVAVAENMLNGIMFCSFRRWFWGYF